jgi:hypothetical protein
MRQPFRTLTLSLEAKDPKERDAMSSAAEESSRSDLHPAVGIGPSTCASPTSREEWGTPKAEPFDPRELLVYSGPTS